MEKSGFFTEKDGKQSMTRLMSFLLLWYFFLSNTVILISVFNGVGDIPLNTLMFILIHDVLVLTGIFAPKQLAKMQEIKGLIETIKNDK